MNYTIIISDIQRLVIAKACQLLSSKDLVDVADDIKQVILEEAAIISGCLDDEDDPLQAVGVNDIS